MTRKITLRQPKIRIYLMVDGQMEQVYLKIIQEREGLENVTIVPELNTGKNLQEQKDNILEKMADYDRVFWLVDFDVVIREKQADAFKGYIQEIEQQLEKYRTDGMALQAVVFINNPCLEFWYLLHYEQTSKIFRSGRVLARHIQKHHFPEFKKVADLSKNQFFYDDQLKPRLPTEPLAKPHK